MPILNVENIASTVDITTNGLHDVAQYTTANVDVEPVISSLNVTPTTSAQTITAPAGTDGYSPVNVSAVDASIDANIASGNIKSGVSILGVSGSVVELNGESVTITPSTSQQTITPTSPHNGITSATVSAVTSSIDANIQAGNIKDGVTILGVTGNYQGGGGAQTPGLILSGAVTAGGTMSNVSTVKLVGVRYLDGGISFADIGVTRSFVTDLNSVDMSVLEGIEATASNGVFQGAFANCDMLDSVNLSSLQYINGADACSGMFVNCISLSSVNLASLRSIGGLQACQEMFGGCEVLDTVQFPLLQSITGAYACSNMFGDCYQLGTVQFPLLQTITGAGACQSMFMHCDMLESISFPALTSSSFGNYTDQFVDMFDGCTALTEIHFPSNVQSVIEGLNGYGMNFGAENATIYFDLAATE